jgi:UDP-GlcNAc:undecaprenyl-phosphate GlcNAc-1-phosphate transferase
VHRNREVSAWFPLMAVGYPVWETMFSIYRRRLVNRKAAMRPDALHFHSLVYRWMTRLKIGHGNSADAWRRNAHSSVVCWMFPLLTMLLAICFWGETWKLACSALGFAAVYVLVYREIANAKNWRRIRRTGVGDAGKGRDAGLVDASAPR